MVTRAGRRPRALRGLAVLCALFVLAAGCSKAGPRTRVLAGRATPTPSGGLTESPGESASPGASVAPGTSAAPGAKKVTSGRRTSGSQSGGGGSRPASVRIGIHGPLTGYGTIPSPDDLLVYWPWLNNQGGINGTKVDDVGGATDDTATDAGGAAACRSLAGKDVRLMYGLSLPQAVAAAAQCATDQGIPYVTTTYFAAVKGMSSVYVWAAGSATYQPTLARYLVHRRGKTKIAMLRTDSPYTADDRDVFGQTLGGLGATLDSEDLTVSLAGQSVGGVSNALLKLKSKLQSGAIDAVALDIGALEATAFFLQASADSFWKDVWFVGGGFGVDAALLGYKNLSGGSGGLRIVWPFASFESNGPAQQEFRAAFARYRPSSTVQDWDWLGWAGMRVMHRILQKADPDYSDAGILKAVRSFKWDGGGMVAPIDFTTGSHVGASQATILMPSGGKWVQDPAFPQIWVSPNDI